MSTKISQLTSATDVTASDFIQIVDVEDGVMAPSGTNKKVTASLLAKELAKQPLEPGIVISGSSSGDAVRITQTGSGNALVVEDSTSPDATPFVVSALGKVISGSMTSKTFRNIYTGGQMTPRFQLQGDVGDEASNVIFHSQNDAGSGLTGFARSRGTLAASTALQNGDLIGVTTYQAYDGVEFLEAARIQAVVDQPVSIGDVSAAIVFVANSPGLAAGVSERMRITSAGNVGIGTATPTAKLNVVDNSSSDALRITQTGSGNALVVEDSTNPDATPFVVAGNGHVGIGTASPQAPLDIESSGIRINAGRKISSNSNDGSVSVFGGESLNGANIELYGSSHVGSPNMAYIDADVTYLRSADGAFERMRITSSGDVGIGMASPVAKLDVSTSSVNAALRVTQTGTGHAILIEDSASPDANPLVVTGNGRLIVGSATSTSVYNPYTGSYLDSSSQITGSSTDSASQSIIQNQNGSAGPALFLAKSRDYSAAVSGDDSGLIVFQAHDGDRFLMTSYIRATVDSTPSSGDVAGGMSFSTRPSGGSGPVGRMWITSSGNIGVATSVPSSKFHINGDLTMSSATVAISATAGANGDVPAQVAGYLVVNINGTARKIPYYA